MNLLVLPNRNSSTWGKLARVSVTNKCTWAARHDISLSGREEVWPLILEPFIEDDLGRRAQAETMARLERAGVTPAEVKALRAEVAEPLATFNAVHQDRFHLGLDDVLAAMSEVLSAADFRTFHGKAMAVADRAQETPQEPVTVWRGSAAEQTWTVRVYGRRYWPNSKVEMWFLDARGSGGEALALVWDVSERFVRGELHGWGKNAVGQLKRALVEARLPFP